MAGRAVSESALFPLPIRPESEELKDDEEDGSVDDGLAEEEECAKPVARKMCHLPSVAEQKLHRLTHTPYRPWCPECVAGRKANYGHRSEVSVRDELSLPEIHLDYCFLRNEPKGESTPVLVVKDRDSKALAAHVVPYKGGDLEWAVLQTVRDLTKWGIVGDLIVRSDQEPALKDFVNELVKLRAKKGLGRTFVEYSAVRESQSNGFIEAGVKTVEGLVRTMKLALEKRLEEILKISQPVFAWLVEHAADVATKYGRGHDGVSPYRRLKGKDCKGELFEFGCRVYHRVPGKTQGGLMIPRCLEGIWLGKRLAIEEHIVSMPDGRVVRTRAVQAVAEEMQWCRDRVLGVTGLP